MSIKKEEKAPPPSSDNPTQLHSPPLKLNIKSEDTRFYILKIITQKI
jgi:hypothetical protein